MSLRVRAKIAALTLQAKTAALQLRVSVGRFLLFLRPKDQADFADRHSLILAKARQDMALAYEELIRAVEKVRRDAVGLSDEERLDVHKGLADVSEIGDEVYRAIEKPTADPARVLDDTARQAAKGLFENPALTDDFYLQAAFVREPVEEATVAEATVARVDKLLGDLCSACDAMQGRAQASDASAYLVMKVVVQVAQAAEHEVRSLEKLLADQIGLQDASKMQLSKAVSDTARLAEHVEAALLKALVDGLSAEDKQALLASKPLIEGLAGEDSAERNVFKFRGDVFTVADEQLYALSKLLFETVGLDEGLERNLNKPFLELLESGESAELQFGKTRGDSFTSTDSDLWALGKSSTDFAGLADGYALRLDKFLGELCSACDGVQGTAYAGDDSLYFVVKTVTQLAKATEHEVRSFEKLLNEGVAGLDAAKAFFSKATPEGFSASENSVRYVGKGLVDSAGLNDDAAVDFSRPLHDAAIFTELAVAETLKSSSDVIAGADQAALLGGKGLFESSVFSDATTAWVDKRFGDSCGACDEFDGTALTGDTTDYAALKVLVQSATAGDEQVQSVAKGLADNSFVSERVIFARVQFYSDAAQSSDGQFAIAMTLGASGFLELSQGEDVSTRNLTKHALESAAASDVHRTDLVRVVDGDLVQAADDALVYQLARLLLDSAGFDDLMGYSLMRPAADSAAAEAQAAVWAGKSTSDSCGATDGGSLICQGYFAEDYSAEVYAGEARTFN